MHAIIQQDDQLIWQETEDLAVAPGEVLIRIRATAINRADLLQRAGLYPVPPGASPIMGLECAGEVAEVGEGVSNFQPGDKVCALLAGGGYAQYVAVPAGQVLPLPAGCDFSQGAALPEVFATTYLNLFRLGALAPKEKVLIHAGASGIGTAAIQLCKAFDNPCFVTAGSAEKIAYCQQLGAEGGSIRGDKNFAEEVAQWTTGQGVNVTLDPVGGSYLADNLASLAPDGRLVIIGLMGGASAEVNLGLMLIKRLKIIGSTLRALPVSTKSSIMKDLHEKLWPLFENGQLQPIIDTVMPIQEADAAHALLAGNTTKGKVVLTVE